MHMILGKKIEDKIFAWGLAAPSIIALTALSIYPFITAVQTSLYSINTISRESSFVGFDNYSWVLSSTIFWESLVRSFEWAIPGVILQLILAVICSLVLHQELKGRNFARGMVLIPYLIPNIVGSIVWRFMLNPTVGIINYVLVDLLGVIDKPLMWLMQPKTALFAVILVGIWHFTPFMIILILGRLQTLPIELYDAAKIDGADSLQLFWFVTLPWIMPIILVAAMLRTIWLFNHFDLVYLMAFGGPMGATTTVPVLIFTTAFDNLRMGRAAAISMFLVIILLVASIAYTWSYSRAEERLRD